MAVFRAKAARDTTTRSEGEGEGVGLGKNEGEAEKPEEGGWDGLNSHQ
jgi:hypothetical protein